MDLSGDGFLLYGRDPQASAACTAVFGGNGRDGFEPADSGETPQEHAERTETRSEIQRAISAVPETMREVFLLRDVHGLSVEETAQALQIAQGTVKSRLVRAREKIAAELKRRGVGETGGERHAV